MRFREARGKYHPVRLSGHFAHFQKHGIRKNDAPVLVADDHALIEAFKNASHLIKPLLLS